jgi:hypothetical protein
MIIHLFNSIVRFFNRIICFFIGHKPYRVKWTNSFYIKNGVIHFTTALNEILVIKNIKEFYVNDICVDMDVNTI